MSLREKHPEFSEMLADWQKMRDVYKGARAVKEKKVLYLPATQSMTLDGMADPEQLGWKNYIAFLTRAYFPDYTKEAVETAIGLMHGEEAVIEVPDVMKPLLEKITPTGESAQLLLRKINEEQLVTGRVGLLVDINIEVADPSKALPYIALYTAETITNWDAGNFDPEFNSLNMVVLNETASKRTSGFLWQTVEAYRVLILGEQDANELSGKYLQGYFEADKNGTVDFDATQLKAPMYKGTTLEEIPFTFINTKDIHCAVDEPPMNGLAEMCLTIYRGDADYRQNLYMQGQDTLVIIGGLANPAAVPGNEGDGDEDAIRVGAGSRINLDIGGDAKYIGVNSQGLSEQRQALTDDKQKAEVKSGQLLDVKGSNQESGVALRMRVAGRTASLNQIAMSGAAGLESALKQIARWIGADDTKVKVTPNLEFIDTPIPSDDVLKLTSAKTMGAPISNETIHGVLVQAGVTKKTYEEEMAAVEEDVANMALGNPNKDPTTPPFKDPNAPPNNQDTPPPNA